MSFLFFRISRRGGTEQECERKRLGRGRKEKEIGIREEGVCVGGGGVHPGLLDRPKAALNTVLKPVIRRASTSYCGAGNYESF